MDITQTVRKEARELVVEILGDDGGLTEGYLDSLAAPDLVLAIQSRENEIKRLRHKVNRLIRKYKLK